MSQNVLHFFHTLLVAVATAVATLIVNWFDELHGYTDFGRYDA